MTHICLQHIVENIPGSHLPRAWADHDLEFFSPATGVKFEIAQDELDGRRAFVKDGDDRVLLALADAAPKQVRAGRNEVLPHHLFTVNGRRYGDLR